MVATCKGGRDEALCNDGGSNHQLVWLGDCHLGMLGFSGVGCQWTGEMGEFQAVRPEKVLFRILRLSCGMIEACCCRGKAGRVLKWVVSWKEWTTMSL